jgi:hypothetical protein
MWKVSDIAQTPAQVHTIEKVCGDEPECTAPVCDGRIVGIVNSRAAELFERVTLASNLLKVPNPPQAKNPHTAGKPVALTMPLGKLVFDAIAIQQDPLCPGTFGIKPSEEW